MARRESPWAKMPDYRVDLEPSAERVRVRFAGELVADSTRTLIVREAQHAPVVYFPREDVRMEELERSDHQSFCPFKGQARYGSLRSGDRRSQEAVWSYEDPFPEVAGPSHYVAFYPDRVEWQRGD